MTDISKLGEFGLIDRLTKDIKPKNDSTIYGVGDDCAVLNYPDTRVLTTTDMLMEGVHFDLTYITMQQLGYKAAMVNLSDVFAMNGSPRQLLVSLAVDKRFDVESIDDFYTGLRQACDKWNVDIIGGDTTSSRTGLAISITCIGEAQEKDIVYRNGASETDIICVSGDLGAAYMGLQLLEREKNIFYEQYDALSQKVKKAEKSGDKDALKALSSEEEALRMYQPDFAGKEYIIDRQLRPEARGDIMAQLHEANIHPTAMMDISDGLSSEILHICNQSHCGCRIYENKIPIDYQTAVMAEELNMNVTTCALNGGEDYELLFTVPIGDHEKLNGMDNIKQIGYITKESLGKCSLQEMEMSLNLQPRGGTRLNINSHLSPITPFFTQQLLTK